MEFRRDERCVFEYERRRLDNLKLHLASPAKNAGGDGGVAGFAWRGEKDAPVREIVTQAPRTRGDVPRDESQAGRQQRQVDFLADADRLACAVGGLGGHGLGLDL